MKGSTRSVVIRRGRRTQQERKRERESSESEENRVVGGGEGDAAETGRKEGTKRKKEEKREKRPGRSIAFALSGRRVDVIIYDVVNSDAKLRVACARARAFIPLAINLYPRARWSPHKYGLRKCVSLQSHLSSRRNNRFPRDLLSSCTDVDSPRARVRASFVAVARKMGTPVSASARDYFS